jgi:hypothetical protein
VPSPHPPLAAVAGDQRTGVVGHPHQAVRRWRPIPQDSSGGAAARPGAAEAIPMSREFSPGRACH